MDLLSGRGEVAAPMSRSTVELIDDLAAGQHGLVTRAQLLHAGLGAATVQYRVGTRRLRPVHRGVYRVGPPVALREREMAAVLACGSTSFVSHRSAAKLWEMLSGDHVAPVDITVRLRDRRVRPTIRVHRGPAPRRTR